MPFPRRLPLALGLALLVLPAHALANPLLGGSIHGTGTLSSLTVYRDSGEAFEGGAYRRNIACIDCLVKLNVTTASVTVVQNGTSFDLEPGLWEVREFKGYFGYTQRGLGHLEFRIDGQGTVVDLG